MGWIALMPDSAVTRRRQTCSTPNPKGQTIPMPVTTTRRMVGFLSRGPLASLLFLLFDVVDRVFDGGYFLGLLLGDFDAEGFLEGHHEFDRVEAVRAQIVAH